MAQLDKFLNEIRQARTEHGDLVDEIGKPSMSMYVLSSLEEIPEASAFLSSIEQRKRLPLIRQYLKRLADREETLRVKASIEKASKAASELRFRIRLNEKCVAKFGLSYDELNSKVRMPNVTQRTQSVSTSNSVNVLARSVPKNEIGNERTVPLTKQERMLKEMEERE